MFTYVRPPIDAKVFRDAQGDVINYGDRWGIEPAPDHAYSVVTDADRFAPLHTVANALIEYLEREYDVAVTEDAACAADLMNDQQDVVRAVRVTPSDPRSASLTFVFTEFPGVLVHAGLLHDFMYPVCGCDACDDNWDHLADEMESEVFGVVAGDYRESVERHPRLVGKPWITFSLSGSSGGTTSHGMPKPRLDAARKALTNLPDGWRAWSPRSSAVRP